jgi:hypothetical protein
VVTSERVAFIVNLAAGQLDHAFGTSTAQLELVRFLHGQERVGVAVEQPVEVFRASWRRPKWPGVVAESSSGESP